MTAAVDLSPSNGGTLAGPGNTGQFLAVKLTAARAVNLANSGGEAVVGILQNQPAAGQAADVGFLGVSKLVAGAAVSAGAELMTDTSARGITATSTNHRFAVALEAATAAGQIITVLLGGSQLSRATS